MWHLVAKLSLWRSIKRHSSPQTIFQVRRGSWEAENLTNYSQHEQVVALVADWFRSVFARHSKPLPSVKWDRLKCVFCRVRTPQSIHCRVSHYTRDAACIRYRTPRRFLKTCLLHISSPTQAPRPIATAKPIALRAPNCCLSWGRAAHAFCLAPQPVKQHLNNKPAATYLDPPPALTTNTTGLHRTKRLLYLYTSNNSGPSFPTPRIAPFLAIRAEEA